jgi:hypothetical protein
MRRKYGHRPAETTADLPGQRLPTRAAGGPPHRTPCRGSVAPGDGMVRADPAGAELPAGGEGRQTMPARDGLGENGNQV